MPNATGRGSRCPQRCSCRFPLYCSCKVLVAEDQPPTVRRNIRATAGSSPLLALRIAQGLTPARRGGSAVAAGSRSTLAAPLKEFEQRASSIGPCPPELLAWQGELPDL